MPDLQSMRRAVVLSTDCGAEVDDQWTVAHLALSQELDLRAIVTTHAPNLAHPAAEATACVVNDVLDHMPLSCRPPVFAGSSIALENKAQPHANAGVEFIINESRAFGPENKLFVMMIGAATDVASALIADPTLQDRVHIVSMAFINSERGEREWNVMNDVKAWQVILESRAQLTVGDATTCIRDLKLHRDKAYEMFSHLGEHGAYLCDLLRDWLAANPDPAIGVTGDPHTWTVWDQITLAHLMGMTETQHLPRPILQDDMCFAPQRSSETTVEWVTAVDAPRLWNDLAIKLSNSA